MMTVILRMKVRNRYRWNDLNSWYGYDRYSIGYNYSYGSYNNPYQFLELLLQSLLLLSEQ